MTDLAPARVDVPDPAPDARRSLVRRVLRNPVGLVATLLLLAVVLLGLLSPLVAPFDPGATRLDRTNVAPFTTDYLLGGDHVGRDVLSRLMHATLGTVQACLVVLAVSASVGVTAGLVAGYVGGRIDEASDAVSNVVLALPSFVLLIALYTVIGPNVLVAMAVFGLLIAPTFFRLVRSLVRSVRHELYVDAARVAGLSDRRIVARHVLRAVRGPVVVHGAFVLAAGIAIEAGLEFLGLGDPGDPSWGGMLQEAFANIYTNGTAVVWPAALIGVTTLALVLLGNVVRDTLQDAASRPKALRASVVRSLREQAATSGGSETADAAGLGPAARAAGPEERVLLRVEGLRVGYPTSPSSVRTVVHGVDLEVRRGEVHGLVGESGSGKSQIAFSLLGILPPEAVVLGGSVVFDGRDLLADAGALRAVRGRRIAYVPQEPMTNLDPTLTVGQQLVRGLRAVTDLDRRAAGAHLLGLLDQVGIADPERVFRLHPHQISGGMAQRVLIAGALAGDPELVVADEPTTALDVTVQAEILDLLRDLQRERDLGVLLVTHNLGVVADVCDHVSVMKEGRIVESRPVHDLFAAPGHDYTRMLLGSSMDGAALRAPLDLGGAPR